MADKALTMMRLGELHCFEEDQRVMIFEMVKSGDITIEEALAEVKKTRPRTFGGLKYFGSVACAAPTLQPQLTTEQGTAIMKTTVDYFKKSKEIINMKVRVTVSTIGVRITDATNEDSIENEAISQIAYVGLIPGDKKKVAYITSYSRLGLVYCHVFQLAKPREATDFIECILDRKEIAATDQSKISSAEKMALDEGDDEEDASGAPLAVFHLQYLGNTPCQSKDDAGDDSSLVLSAVKDIKNSLDPKKKDKKKKAPGVDVSLVVSSEGLRTVESSTREVMHNVLIKAVSYSTEIIGKKMEMFAYIEVDDRRGSNTCHVFLCKPWEKHQAIRICEGLQDAFKQAVKEATARAGNPLLPWGRVRDNITGPLAECQIAREDLVATKAIGAGQFGKVYLVSKQGTDGLFAVKMLRGGASQGDRGEFIREAETMLSIGTHTNLVNFVGVAIRQRPWLVILEFCQYGDLSDVLRACRRKKMKLGLSEQMMFAEQLCRGMQFIHSKKFVHMDLACRNCLLHASNTVKVADFGLTHPYDSGKKSYRQVGMLKLSIRWLAIDSFDSKLFFESSDVWSFGVTMWEVFTYGKQPYHPHGLHDVLRMVRAGTRLEKPTHCPDDVWEIILTCWDAQRKKRPTFAKLLKSIEFIIKQNELPAAKDVGEYITGGGLTQKLQRLSIKRKGGKDAKPQKPKGLIGVIGEDDAKAGTGTLPKSFKLPEE